MKLTQDNREIVRSQEFEEAEMGIDAEGMPFVISILRDKIYSDKVLAVCREVISNGVDAMMENGNQKIPLQVHIPNSIEPYFKVRDFGKGLSYQEFVNIYIKYGNSTKRDSNDYIGALGLGAKAPLCYTDSFVITSYHGGKKSCYTLYIDETNRGKMATLSVEESNEPTGLEICVPVNTSDFYEFKSKTLEVIRHFKTKPVIIGVDQHEIPTWERSGELCGDDWCYLNGGAERSVCIQGGVAYPVNTYALNDKLSESAYNVIREAFEMEFDIGELSVSASREALEYNKTTIQAIETKAKKIISEITPIIINKVQNAPDLFEAKRLYHKFVVGHYSLASSLNLKLEIKWRGNDIEDSHVDLRKINNGTGIEFIGYYFRRSRRRSSNLILKVIQGHNIDVSNSNYTFVINDLNKTRGVKPRIQTALNSLQKGGNNPYIYLLRFENDKAIAEFENYTQVKISDWKKLSEFELAINEHSGSTRNGFKHNTDVFTVLNCSYLRDFALRDYAKKSRIWEETEDYDEETGGVYINITRYTPDNYSIETFADIIKYAKVLFNDFPEIIGVRKSPALSVDWIPFEDWIKEKLTNLTENIDMDEAESANELVRNYGGKLPDYLQNRNGLFQKFFTKLNAVKIIAKQFSNEKLVAINFLAAKFGVKVNRKVKHRLASVYKKISERYPLLEYLLEGYSVRYHNTIKADIIEYIEAIDVYKPLQENNKDNNEEES